MWWWCGFCVQSLHCTSVTLHMLFEWDALVLVLVWYKCTMVNQLKEFSNLRTKWRTQSEIFIIWLGFVFIALSILYRSYTLLPCPPRRPFFFFTQSHLCEWKKHGQAIVYYRLMGHVLLRLPEKNWISIGPYKIPSSAHMVASWWLTSLLLVALLILTRYRGDSCGFVIIVSFKPLVIGANTCNMDWNALNAYWYFSLYLKWFPIDHLEWVTDAVLFLPLMLLFFHISLLMWESHQVPI